MLNPILGCAVWHKIVSKIILAEWHCECQFNSWNFQNICQIVLKGNDWKWCQYFKFSSGKVKCSSSFSYCEVCLKTLKIDLIF